MEPKSFSEFLKNEILEFDWTEEQLQILFYSFLRTNGVFRNGKYIVTTTLKQWNNLFLELLEKHYNAKPIVSQTDKLLKYTFDDPDFLSYFSKKIGSVTVKDIEENKAYLAGAYLGKGWVNSPESRFYHLEIRVRHLSHSLDIQEAFDGLGIKTITIEKSGWFYTYVKKAADISNTLKAFHASESVMMFEDSRIERDFIATYKKMESIEKHNLQKTQATSIKQIDAINKLKEKNIFNSLKEDEKTIAEIRINHPDFSLSEIQLEFSQKTQKEVSRSYININLNKMLRLAEEIN